MCTRRFKQLYLGDHSELDTRSYEYFLLQRPLILPSKIWTFPRESPCVQLSQSGVAVARLQNSQLVPTYSNKVPWISVIENVF